MTSPGPNPDVSCTRQHTARRQSPRSLLHQKRASDAVLPERAPLTPRWDNRGRTLSLPSNCHCKRCNMAAPMPTTYRGRRARRRSANRTTASPSRLACCAKQRLSRRRNTTKRSGAARTYQRKALAAETDTEATFVVVIAVIISVVDVSVWRRFEDRYLL